MRKPVLFYQFDEKEFREKQYGQGYFDYKNTVLAKWTDNVDELLNLLDGSLSQNCQLIDEATIKEFFPYIDKNNSERIYDEIKRLGKKK